MVNADFSFGTNPFDILHEQTFSYTFYGTANKRFTYYTVAIYQQNWGLTGQLKSEYQIRVKNEVSTQAAVQAAATQSTSGSSVLGISIAWSGESRISGNVQNLLVKNIDGKADFIQ